MTWTEETSGIISLSSAGSWLGNILSRNLTGKAGVNLNALNTSVGTVWSDVVGSDRTQHYVLLNE